jgi:hypothetical protein
MYTSLYNACGWWFCSLSKATNDCFVLRLCFMLFLSLQFGIRAVGAARCHVRFDILLLSQELLSVCDMLSTREAHTSVRCFEI